MINDVLERLASGLNPELQSPQRKSATQAESPTMFLPHLCPLEFMGIHTRIFSWALLPEIIFACRNLKQLHIYFHFIVNLPHQA